MCSSPIRSSSAVVTPRRMWSPTSAIVSATSAPAPNRLRRVVRPPLERRALAQPLDRDLVGNLELEDEVELPVDLPQHRVQRLGLDEGAREAVEDEAVLRVRGREPVADQLDHEVVGNEAAAVVDRLHLAAERRVVRDRAPEDVARR